MPFPTSGLNPAASYAATLGCGGRSHPGQLARNRLLTHDGYTLARILNQVILRPIAPDPDINGDGVVDVTDLVQLILAWGACDGECPEDLDGDGQVAVTDLVILIANWG